MPTLVAWTRDRNQRDIARQATGKFFRLRVRIEPRKHARPPTALSDTLGTEIHQRLNHIRYGSPVVRSTLNPLEELSAFVVVPVNRRSEGAEISYLRSGYDMVGDDPLQFRGCFGVSW